MKCPHCGAERLEHPDGRLHCNQCGCCFEGEAVRPGHPHCGAEPAVAETPEVVAEEPIARPAIPAEKVKGTKRGADDPAVPEDIDTPDRKVSRGR